MRGRWLVAVLLTVCLMLAGCGQANSSILDNSSSSLGETEAVRQDTESNDTTEDIEIEAEPQTDSADTNGYPDFDFESKTVTLNSGYEMESLRHRSFFAGILRWALW